MPQIVCPVCKQTFEVEQGSGKVSCPDGHLITLHPAKRPAAPAKKGAGPRKAESPRPAPAPPAGPPPGPPAPRRSRLGLILVFGGLAFFLVASIGGIGIFLVFCFQEKDGPPSSAEVRKEEEQNQKTAPTTNPPVPPVEPERPRVEVKLLVSEKQEAGEAFTVRAVVRHATPGLALTLELPEGLALVRGSERQEVAPAEPDGEVVLSWSVRGERAGERNLTVRPSAGPSQTAHVVVAEKPAAARAVTVRVLGGEEQEVGKEVSIDAVVASPAPDQTLTLKLPEGVSLALGQAKQEVGKGEGSRTSATWVVKVMAPGNKTFSVRSSDGTTREFHVFFQEKKESTVASSKLDFRKFDKLDASTLDIKLTAPKAEERIPDVWDGHTNHIRCVSYTDDGLFVISVSGDMSTKVKRPADNSIRVWDARRGKQLHKVEGFREALDSLALSPGGRFALFSPGGYWEKDEYFQPKDFGVYLWDIQAKRAIRPDVDVRTAGTSKEEKPKARYTGAASEVWATGFSPDRQKVAIGDISGKLGMWDNQKGEALYSREGLPGIRVLSFTPDGEYLVLGCNDSSLRVLRAANGQAVSPPLTSHIDLVWMLAVTRTRDGQLLAVSGGGDRERADGKGFEPGSRDYAIRIWDLNRGQVLRKCVGHTELVQALAFCPNGRQFISSGGDGTVRLWDVQSGKELRQLGKAESSVRSVAVAPDGRSCVAGGGDCKIYYYRLPTALDLAEALKNEDAKALEKVAADMEVIGADGLESLNALLEALGKGKPAVRAPAGRVLVRLAEALAPREVPFEAGHAPALGRLLESGEAADVRVLAVRGLGTLGPKAAEAVPGLLKALSGSTEVEVNAASAEALGKVGVKSPEVVAALVKGMEHEDASVRARSLLSLSGLSPEALSVEVLLRRLETDSSADVQKMADRALRTRLTTLTARDVPALRGGLKSRPVRVCLLCVEALTGLKGEAGEAAPELALLLRRPEEEVRLAALRALRAVGDAGKEAVPELARLVQSGESRSAVEAGALLTKLDPGNALVGSKIVGLLLKGLKPATPAEANAIVESPLDREAAKSLLEIGEPAVRPLVAVGLAGWAPQRSANKDLPTTLARYQTYKILIELAGRAGTDEKLRATLRKQVNDLRLTHVGKERLLAKEARLSVPAAEAEVYTKTLEACQAALLKLDALPVAGRPAKEP